MNQTTGTPNAQTETTQASSGTQTQSGRDWGKRYSELEQRIGTLAGAVEQQGQALTNLVQNLGGAQRVTAETPNWARELVENQHVLNKSIQLIAESMQASAELRKKELDAQDAYRRGMNDGTASAVGSVAKEMGPIAEKAAQAPVQGLLRKTKEIVIGDLTVSEDVVRPAVRSFVTAFAAAGGIVALGAVVNKLSPIKLPSVPGVEVDGVKINPGA